MLSPVPAVEHVVAGAAQQHVIARIAQQRVVAAPAEQDIVAVAAFERDLRCQRPKPRASMMSSPPTPSMWMVSPASKCSDHHLARPARSPAARHRRAATAR